MGGLLVCFSETAFNGMQTPAARLGSRPKRWLMCDWQRVLTQIQPGKEMHNSSSINTQPMSIWAHKRFGSLKQRKVIDLSAYVTGEHIGYDVQVSPEHRPPASLLFLSATLRCWHRRHFVKFYEPLSSECLPRRHHLTGERSGTDRAKLCAPCPALWCYVWTTCILAHVTLIRK